MDEKWHLCLLKKSNNKRTTGEWNLKSIPWNARWDTSWPGGDLWGCTEGIQAAVKGIDGWPRSRWDGWGTEGRRGVKRSSKRRRRIHGRSWRCAPNCRRAVRGRGCRGSQPALRCWAARKTWFKWMLQHAPQLNKKGWWSVHTCFLESRSYLQGVVLAWKRCWRWCHQWCAAPPWAHDTCATFHPSAGPGQQTPPWGCSDPQMSRDRRAAQSGWNPSPRHFHTHIWRQHDDIIATCN